MSDTTNTALPPEESGTGPAIPLTWQEIAFTFQGRISRATFWAASLYWLIAYSIITFIVAIVLKFLFHLPGTIEDYAFIAFLLSAWVLFAIQAKRWHDLGITGWVTLTLLIPGSFPLLLFVLGIIPGNPDTNKYGINPLSIPEQNNLFTPLIILLLIILFIIAVIYSVPLQVVDLLFLLYLIL